MCLQCRKPGFDPWVGKIPWRRKWQPTPVFLPGESHGERSLVGYSPRGRKESDTAEQLHFHFHMPNSSAHVLTVCNIPSHIFGRKEILINTTGVLTASQLSPFLPSSPEVTTLKLVCVLHLWVSAFDIYFLLFSVFIYIPHYLVFLVLFSFQALFKLFWPHHGACGILFP